MAYINTVHKYQGSENDYIILILPSKDDYLKRNLIYTAVSRAKKQCIIIGDRDVFEKCIKSNEIRNSRLYEMIISNIRPQNKEIIDKEDKRKPFSDDKLAELLNDEGIHIARRTVAKYREQLRLPVARLRKEL